MKARRETGCFDSARTDATTPSRDNSFLDAAFGGRLCCARRVNPVTGSIDILLATYNGAAFLPEQLDSLFIQTCQNWRILARDDGSTDGTREILARYSASHPGRFFVLPPDEQRLGASASFGALLAQSDAPYVMFCDQDDIWLPDKVALTMAKMRELEGKNGEKTPLLVNTDLKIVDRKLAVLNDSMWRFQRIYPQRLTKLSRVLMQNFATGNTVMINRSLATLAGPIPTGAIMHDWWLALVAIAFGKVFSIPRATVLYRQHGRNDIGVSRWKFSTGIKNFFLYRDRRRSALVMQNKMFETLGRQATAFAERFSGQLAPAGCEMLQAFCTLRAKSFLGRRRLMLKHNFWVSDRWMNFVMLLRWV
jgi:glycosyltransferase involved in cell wall biosynthesis